MFLENIALFYCQTLVNSMTKDKIRVSARIPRNYVTFVYRDMTMSPIY